MYLSSKHNTWAKSIEDFFYQSNIMRNYEPDLLEVCEVKRLVSKPKKDRFLFENIELKSLMIFLVRHE